MIEAKLWLDEDTEELVLVAFPRNMGSGANTVVSKNQGRGRQSATFPVITPEEGSRSSTLIEDNGCHPG